MAMHPTSHLNMSNAHHVSSTQPSTPFPRKLSGILLSLQHKLSRKVDIESASNDPLNLERKIYQAKETMKSTFSLDEFHLMEKDKLKRFEELMGNEETIRLTITPDCARF